MSSRAACCKRTAVVTIINDIMSAPDSVDECAILKRQLRDVVYGTRCMPRECEGRAGWPFKARIAHTLSANALSRQRAFQRCCAAGQTQRPGGHFQGFVHVAGAHRRSRQVFAHFRLAARTAECLPVKWRTPPPPIASVAMTVKPPLLKCLGLLVLLPRS